MTPSRLALVVLGLTLFAATARADAQSTGVIADDTPWATPYFVVDSGVEGPTVMIVGGMHGNEPAGARAADQIRHWPLLKGRLVVVPEANRPGLAAAIRFMPDEPKATRDLNRRFPPRAQHPLVRDLWGLVEEYDPDWLLDLHEGYDFHQINSDSVGSSIIHIAGKELNAHADAMLESVNATIKEPNRRLVPLRRSGPVRGSLARAAAQRGIRAMILETTYKDQRLPIRARQHRIMVHRLLHRLGVVGPDLPHRLAPSHTERLRVALYDDGGVGGSGPKHLERILRNAGVIVHRVDRVDVAARALDDFDVAIFPGGSGSGQSRSLGDTGRQRVRAFVRNGGGYVGICGGAYLATAGFDWGLGVIDARTLSSKWRRGKANVDVELTDPGRRELPGGDEMLKIRYHNGPILGPAGKGDVPDYEVWARFRSEVADNGTPKGLMVDTPAIVAGPFGDGRAVAISPHPESTERHYPLVLRAIRWSAGIDASTPVPEPAPAAQ